MTETGTRYLGVLRDGDAVHHMFDNGPGTEHFDLDASAIKAAALVDMVREGVQEGRVYSPAAPPAQDEPGPRAFPAGKGEADGWSWETFDSDGAALVALSNRPLIDAYASNPPLQSEENPHPRSPALMQAVVPASVLAAALGL